MINKSQNKMTEQKIAEIIENIIDPDLNLSIGQMNALDSIKIENEEVTIKLNLVGPIYWVAQSINDLAIAELRKFYPNVTFEILIAEKSQDTSARPVLPGVKNIICVASGKGGVGKSSIASNIAAALSLKGANVGVLDGDVYGPSQPTMFGLTSAKLDAVRMADGSTKAVPVKKFGLSIASMGFIMEQKEAAIVRGPMLAGYFSMLFEQIYWGPLDFLVFDLPPGTGDIQLTMTQKIPLTGAIIVTTPQEIAVADVRRSISMFSKVNVDILGIVENMSYFTPPELPDKKYYIFGEGGGKKVAEEFGINFLGEVPLDLEMRNANDGGIPMVIKDSDADQSKIIIDITAKIVSQIRQRNYNSISTPTLEISI